ncbi:MAG: hypothetical protein ACLGHN_08120 [Bacteriovoracia bacterium]
MNLQRNHCKVLSLAAMLTLLGACGKPIKESKDRHSERIKTEVDEELEVLTNSSPKIEKRLFAKTKALRIRIYPKKVLSPIAEVDRIVRANCGRGTWDRNQVHYEKTKVSWKNYTQNLVQIAKKDFLFKASSPRGDSINGSLAELLKSGDASISTKPYYVEIKLPSKNWSLSMRKEEIDIELSVAPSKTVINVGSMREVRRICTRTPSEAPRGADGGRGGGWYKSFDHSEAQFFEGHGFSAQLFEVQYDLEVYFYSHY